MTLFGNSAYASESMKQFQDNLEKITHQSTASSTVAIVRGDKVFKTSSKQVNDDTQFYIASVTKHMTSFMMLVTLNEKHPEASLKELLSEKLNILFPDSSLLKDIGKDWISEVSLLDLLTHRSGLSDYTDDYQGGLAKTPASFSVKVNPSELLQSISCNPEKTYSYSNSNYFLAGKLLEELRPATFDHIFEKLIKVPAGMQLSFAPVIGNYFILKEEKHLSHLANNSGLNLGTYFPKLQGQYMHGDFANSIGAGNVVSTMDDLIKWGNYLFKSSPKIIRDAMLENYCTDSEGEIIHLGLGTDNKTGYTGHLGRLDSFTSLFAYAFKSDTLVITLSNNEDDDRLLRETFESWTSKPEELTSLNMHQEKLTWSWTKKLIEENESLKFAASYNKAHPDSEDQGYGPFALVPYNDEVVSLGYQTNVWDF